MKRLLLPLISLSGIAAAAEQRDVKSQTLNARELYDYSTDQTESRNLADDPAHARTVAALAKQLSTTCQPPPP